MTPEMFTAICAGATLFIYFTVTIIGSVVAVFRKIDRMRDAILMDVNVKHQQNQTRYEALNTLVTRHDLILNPEFNGNFGHATFERKR